MNYLRGNSSSNIKLGPFLDEDDGKTAEVGLTITQPDIRLSKLGGAFAQKNAAQTLAHDENGWYTCELNSSDTNMNGRLIVAVHESGALPVWREFEVLLPQVYDALIVGTDKLQVDSVEISSSTGAADNVEANISNLDASIATIDGIVDDLKGYLNSANTELASVPTTVSNTIQMIQFIFEYLRNKLETTNSKETLYKEDAVTAFAERDLTDDGTTFTKSEMRDTT